MASFVWSIATTTAAGVVGSSVAILLSARSCSATQLVWEQHWLSSTARSADSFAIEECSISGIETIVD